MNDSITLTIDGAWAEVEAALPEGWSILSLKSFGTGWGAAADAPSLAGPWHKRHARAHGPTPAAALLALAAALRDGRTK